MTTFSRGIRLVSLLSLATVLPLVMGCGLLGKKGDADAAAAADADVAEAAVATEVAEAAAAPAAPVAATNENDISRFPDEKKLDNVAATILRQTNVREIPGIGKVVATLAKGGTVTEIAQRSTFFLVVFDNPKDQKRLMGWINQDAFTAPADAGLKVLSCVAPEVPLISDGPFCGRTCAADTDCPSGQACKGAANKFANAKLGDAVTVCTVFSPPAAAGTLRVAPNVAPTAVVPVAPAVLPIPNSDVTAAVGGRCPVGFLLVAKDNQCHKQCIIGQCRKETTFCIGCGGAKVCSANRDLLQVSERPMSRSSGLRVRGAWRAQSALALVLACTLVTLVCGCSLLKKKKSTDQAPDSPTVTVTGTGVKNEKDVLRYASETKVADEPGTIGKDGVKAKTFPASGGDVATLAKGTTVIQIARFFSTGVLVTFADPATSDGSKLMGWIAPEALAPAAVASATTAAPVFTAPRVAVAVDAGARTGGVDAGSAAAAAGGTAAAAAGASASAAPPTAGGGVGTITALPTGGRCPAGMILVPPLCRKPCASDADCKGAFCTQTGGKKTCSATR